VVLTRGPSCVRLFVRLLVHVPRSTLINFTAAQQQLITAVTSAAKGPVVAFVFSGGAMDVSPLLSNPKARACRMTDRG
jgi:Na+-transporting methylmalonyl-CoA/oxaloacetate decarboxylase beta subunit